MMKFLLAPFKLRIVHAVAALALVAACVTVNIYFPAAEVEKTAEEIVTDVYGTTGDATQTEPQPGQPPSMLWRSLCTLLGPAPAHAQSATSVSNAAIRGLKQQIAANHQQLAPFYQGGNVGITSNGMLEIRNTGGLGVAQVGQLRRLVNADNQARAQLYQEVAKALKVDASQLPRIQSIFAQQWQGQAGSGWQIQDSNGAWRAK